MFIYSRNIYISNSSFVLVLTDVIHWKYYFNLFLSSFFYWQPHGIGKNQIEDTTWYIIFTFSCWWRDYFLYIMTRKNDCWSTIRWCAAIVFLFFLSDTTAGLLIVPTSWIKMRHTHVIFSLATPTFYRIDPMDSRRRIIIKHLKYISFAKKECIVAQLIPQNYFQGFIYHFEWIRDSIIMCPPPKKKKKKNLPSISVSCSKWCICSVAVANDSAAYRELHRYVIYPIRIYSAELMCWIWFKEEYKLRYI